MAWLNLVLQLGLPLALLLLGLVVGRILERRHYASIRRREKALAGVLVFSTRWPPEVTAAQRTSLVSGSVVISSDHFKTFVAALRNLFGGDVRSYETLMERARREAGVAAMTPEQLARERAAKSFAMYGTLPSYRAMLDHDPTLRAARERAEAFWARPSPQTWQDYWSSCRQLYNTQPPADPDARHRTRYRLEILQHFARGDDFGFRREGELGRGEPGRKCAVPATHGH